MTCPNGECEQHGRRDAGNVVLHGFSRVKGGKRRRYRCTACGKTFGATTGTVYSRMRKPKSELDRVVQMAVPAARGMMRGPLRIRDILNWVVPGPVVRKLALQV